MVSDSALLLAMYGRRGFWFCSFHLFDGWMDDGSPSVVRKGKWRKEKDLQERVYSSLLGLAFGLWFNAIACLQEISNETELPIYLASDSKFGKSYYEHSTPTIRVPTFNKGDPLYIDSDRYQGRDPQDFYQAFVDVYIMQKASCYSHSGGFGLLPLRLNNNLTECEMTHDAYKSRMSRQQ